MEFIGWVGLGFGVVSRIFIPWLNSRRVNPDEAKWSWRYVWPQLVAVLIVALGLPLVLTNVEGVGQLSFAPAYLIGWAVADVGRFVDKAVRKQ
jgi:hypothetical protein